VSSLLVSIATLGRPERAAGVAKSARASVDPDLHDLRIVFMCSPGDDETIAACRETGEEVVVVEWGGGKKGEGAKADWARKHNLAYSTMTEEWILLGSDDLVFHAGWFDACLVAAGRLRGGACVVGTNDLGNRRVQNGTHSTHPLVHRDYIKCGGVIDDPTRLLPEVYGHWFVDDEFVQTAQSRGTYSHAFDALVEHLHPAWGKAENDDTYDLGQETVQADRALYEKRSVLWLPAQPLSMRRRRRG
jgi:hypothetical protein